MFSHLRIPLLVLGIVLANFGVLKGEGTPPLCGIGVVIVGDAKAPNPQDPSTPIVQDHVIVKSFMPDSQAAKGGLLKDDEITQVDDTKVAGMKFKDVLKLIRGEAGTSVKLVVVRKGQAEPLSFTIVRAAINMPPAKPAPE